MKNVIKTIFITLIMLCLQMSVASGEEGVVDVEAKLRVIMSKRRQNEPFGAISEKDMRAVEYERFLSLLEPYEHDSEWTVRNLAYQYEVRLARIQKRPEVRQQVVKRLTEGLFSGRCKAASKWLLSFEQEDFSEESKAMIREALAKPQLNRTGGAPIVWICGVANMREQLPYLKTLLIDEEAYRDDPDVGRGTRWYYTTGWAARLARARMGVEAEIERCLELVQSEENLHTRVTVLLNDVGYIRQPAAIDLLREYLESDERLYPVTPAVPGEPVASYVINIIGECLEDFPLKTRDYRGYKQEEIEEAREWMAKQEEWKIKR